jgi:hypothetical protein
MGEWFSGFIGTGEDGEENQNEAGEGQPAL